MARTYGSNTDASSSAREEMLHAMQQENEQKEKIEKLIIAGAVAFTVIIVSVNILRCVKSVDIKANYVTQQVKTQAQLDELQAKLQDPESQNYVYKIPTIGNMTEAGQAVAKMQNQMISMQEFPVSNQDSSLDLSNIGLSADHTGSGTGTGGGGAVTLDPTDVSPADTVSPDTGTVENSETGMSSTSETGSDDSGYEYTRITNFDDSSTDASLLLPQTAPVNDTRSLAELKKSFEDTYCAKPIPNVDGGDDAWSGYGAWSFSGTYDFSVNAMPIMNAVWICYEASDVSHTQPLAFVTAAYTQANQKFTNFAITYTKYYVKTADRQSTAFGGTTGSGQNYTSNSIAGSTINGEGSENEYTENITGDDANTVNNSASGQAVSISAEDTVPKDETTAESAAPVYDTTPANNPNGTATWTPAK